MLRSYRARRVHAARPAPDGSLGIELSDRAVELGREEAKLFGELVEWLPTRKSEADLAAATGLPEETLRRLCIELASAGVLYRRSDVPQSVDGPTFHREHFAPVLESWLAEAFSHPFWERMTSGRGSARLFAGWLIELYHYTRNANRHMPLSCAYAREKPIKQLRAKHYAEEWNHFHYFTKALRSLGFGEEVVQSSVPLPMTLALSDFMRQAAREDVLCYSICSAVLEGTTTNRGSFNPYYEKMIELYGIPRAAIEPIFAHLDLDVKYQHSDLFLDILKHVDEISAARAGRMLDYGHQLVEHIWMWTDSIERWYGDETNPVPRRSFDPDLD